ncbi:MAG: hypothetical protein V8T82_11080 [Romboutsia timonensis]
MKEGKHTRSCDIAVVNLIESKRRRGKAGDYLSSINNKGEWGEN